MTIWFGYGIGILFLFFIAIVGSCNPSSDTSQAAREEGPDDARAACRTAIKGLLNDADSAQFESGGYANKNPDGTWTAQRTLRAKKAFGAYRLAIFECKLKSNGDGTWRGLDVRQINP